MAENQCYCLGITTGPTTTHLQRHVRRLPRRHRIPHQPHTHVHAPVPKAAARVHPSPPCSALRATPREHASVAAVQSARYCRARRGGSACRAAPQPPACTTRRPCRTCAGVTDGPCSHTWHACTWMWITCTMAMLPSFDLQWVSSCTTARTEPPFAAGGRSDVPTTAPAAAGVHA